MRTLFIFFTFLATACDGGDDPNPYTPPGPVNDDIVRFSDNFEGPFNLDPSNLAINVWYESLRGQSTASVTGDVPARSGEKCLEMTLIANENSLSRSEIGLNLRNSLGDYWYGLSVFIPSEYDISQMVLDQDDFVTVLAQWGVWENNPGLPDFALRLGRKNGENKFYLTYEPSTSLDFLWEAPLIQGEWVDWIFHIKWTKDDTGVFKVWQNRNLVFSKIGFQSTDGEGSEVKSKIGLYYSNWGDRQRGFDEIKVFYDNFTVAKGEDMFDAVDPSLR